MSTDNKFKIYAKGWVDKDNFIHDFSELKGILQDLDSIDKNFEDLKTETKNLESNIDYNETRITYLEEQYLTIENDLNNNISCVCNPEIIQDITKRLSKVETEIGADDGDLDKNLNDIKSKLSSLQSSINGNRLIISDNKTNLQSQINTINGNVANLQSQIKEVKNNANFDAYTQTIEVPAGSVYTMRQINSDGTLGEVNFYTIADAINSLENSIINFYNRF